MKEEMEKQYKEYIEEYNLEDTLEEKANFFWDGDTSDKDYALELYKQMGRNIDELSDWVIGLNRETLSVNEFVDQLSKLLPYFKHDYNKLIGDKKLWPEELCDKLKEYFMD